MPDALARPTLRNSTVLCSLFEIVQLDLAREGDNNGHGLGSRGDASRASERCSEAGSTRTAGSVGYPGCPYRWSHVLEGAGPAKTFCMGIASPDGTPVDENVSKLELKCLLLTA